MKMILKMMVKHLSTRDIIILILMDVRSVRSEDRVGKKVSELRKNCKNRIQSSRKVGI